MVLEENLKGPRNQGAFGQVAGLQLLALDQGRHTLHTIWAYLLYCRGR